MSQNVIDDAIPIKVLINCIEENSANWYNRFNNLIGISAGKKEIGVLRTNVNAIIFEFEQKLTDVPQSKQVPPFISYSYNNRSYKIPTDVIEDTPATADTSYGSRDSLMGGNFFPRRPGTGISRLGNNNGGTIGLKVYRETNGSKEYYLLSCYHVLCAPELQNNITEVNYSEEDEKSVICPALEDGGTKEDILGNVTEGSLNFELDIALAKISKSQLAPQITFPDIIAPLATAEISDSDIEDGRVVYLAGKSSGYQKGYLRSYTPNKRITYNNNYTIYLNGLYSTTKMSTFGDSGAALFYEDGTVIGIVVASSARSTYVIPVSRIEKRIKIKVSLA